MVVPTAGQLAGGAAVALVLLLVLTVARRLRSMRFRDAPYPVAGLATFVIGSFADGTFPDIFERHRRLVELHEELKSNIIRLLRPLGNYLIAFKPKDGKMPKWYFHSSTDSQRASMSSAGVPIDESLLGLPMGHKWGVHRRLIAPLFSAKHLSEFTPVINAQSNQLVEVWKAEYVRKMDDQQGDVLEVASSLYAWSIDIIGIVAFGTKFKALQTKDGMGTKFASNPYLNAAHVITTEILRVYKLGPILSSFNRTAVNANRAAVRLFRETASGIIAACEHPELDENSDAARSLAGKLLKSRDEHTNDSLDTEAVVQEIMSLIMAGHETSSNTLAWALFLLAENQDAQLACRQQVDRAWEASSHPSLTFDELFELDLCLGAIYEALRLFPVVVNTPKYAPEGAVIDGVKIPAGTQCSPNKTAMGLDPALFPNPKKFDPSRFRRKEHGLRGSNMVAFGAGPRICVGYRLAELEMLSALAHILRTFELQPFFLKPKEHYDLTNGPKKTGLMVKVVPRELSSAGSSE